MTPKKPIGEMARPKRSLGTYLRTIVRCPFRGCGGDMKIVAYRRSGPRFECTNCALRFTLGWSELVVAHPPERGEIFRKMVIAAGYQLARVRRTRT